MPILNCRGRSSTGGQVRFGALLLHTSGEARNEAIPLCDSVAMNPGLALWEYALWGAFGGTAIEAIEILGASKRAKTLPWRAPGEVSAGVMMFCIVVRLGLGAGLAFVLGQAGQISGGLGAVAAGVAAPLILEQMSKQIPGQMSPAAKPGDQPVELPQPRPVDPLVPSAVEPVRPVDLAEPPARPGSARPAARIERDLAAVLAEVLGVPQVPVDAHFFADLGADSMLMARFCAKLRKRDDLPAVAMKDVYMNPTIRALAVACAPTSVSAAAPEPPMIMRAAPRGSVVVHRLRATTRAQQVLAGLARSTPAFGGESPVIR